MNCKNTKIQKFCWALMPIFVMGTVFVKTANVNAQKRTFIKELQGIGNYVPQGEVLKGKKLAKFLEGNTEAVQYESKMIDTSAFMPIIPFQIFGVEYAEDIVIETNHPKWNMHEFARIHVADALGEGNGKGRDVWIAKDSDLDGLQTVTADLDHIENWSPEVPIPRRRSPVNVIDHSTDKLFSVEIHYTNPYGEKIDVEFSSPRLVDKEKKTNSSTFNHSNQAVSVVLDVPGKMLFGTKASMKFDGKDYPVRKALGLIGVKALLHQTQGGIAAADFDLKLGTEEGKIGLNRPSSATKEWPSSSQESWTFKPSHLGPRTGAMTYRSTTGEWIYVFKDGGLSEARLNRLDSTTNPIVEFILSAPLPDLSRDFKGNVVRNFIMKINGKTQGYGEVSASSSFKRSESSSEVSSESSGVASEKAPDTSTDSVRTAVLHFKPMEPTWFAVRPMKTTVEVGTSSARVVTKRE